MTLQPAVSSLQPNEPRAVLVAVVLPEVTDDEAARASHDAARLWLRDVIEEVRPSDRARMASADGVARGDWRGSSGIENLELEQLWGRVVLES